MDRVFEPDQTEIRDKRSILLFWGGGAALLLLAIWAGTAVKLALDLQALKERAERLAQSRARTYAEQLRRTVNEIDQISLTVMYQWQRMPGQLDLTDQYALAMHHTPTYPVAIGAEGRILSSWRKASVGLDMSSQAFFRWHREHPDTGLRVNPISVGVGGMAGKRTVRFTRRVDDAQGRFAGVVMVSTEPGYLASLSDDDALSPGDFMAVRLVDGPMLVARNHQGHEQLQPFYSGTPRFPAAQGVRVEPGARFRDGLAWTIGWKQLADYPLVAVAGITDASAVAGYAPTRAAYLVFASVTSLLVMLGAMFGALSQISAADRRRKAERVRATFRLAVDGAREAFYMIEPMRATDGSITDWRVEDCNERAAGMNGLPREQLIGRSLREIYPPGEQSRLMQFFSTAFEQRFHEDELRVTDSGMHQPGWFHRRAMRSGDGLAVSVRDITDAKLHQQTLAQLAVTDTLTGLPNRRWLNEFLPAALARARAERKRVALLFIDLDNFKQVNDRLGHAAGDDLLRAAALCLREAVRSTDHVVRLGGDEFTVLVEHLERDADAELVATQVVNAFTQSAGFARWAALDVRCSVGVALYPSHAQDPARLLQCADEAMYAAKAAGKGCYRLAGSAGADSIRLVS